MTKRIVGIITFLLVVFVIIFIIPRALKNSDFFGNLSFDLLTTVIGAILMFFLNYAFKKSLGYGLIGLFYLDHLYQMARFKLISRKHKKVVKEIMENIEFINRYLGKLPENMTKLSIKEQNKATKKYMKKIKKSEKLSSEYEKTIKQMLSITYKVNNTPKSEIERANTNLDHTKKRIMLFRRSSLIVMTTEASQVAPFSNASESWNSVLNTFLSWSSEFPEIKYYVAVVYEKMSDYENAIRELGELLQNDEAIHYFEKHNNEEGEINKMLASNYFNLKKFEPAFRNYQVYENKCGFSVEDDDFRTYATSAYKCYELEKQNTSPNSLDTINYWKQETLNLMNRWLSNNPNDEEFNIIMQELQQ